MISVYNTLIQFAIECYPEHIQLVDSVLQFCIESIHNCDEYAFILSIFSSIQTVGIWMKFQRNFTQISRLSHSLPKRGVKPKAVKAIINLLHTPLKRYRNILKVLSLTYYGGIIEALQWEDKKRIAVDIVQVIHQPILFILFIHSFIHSFIAFIHSFSFT
jgi:hypothetical protein